MSDPYAIYQHPHDPYMRILPIPAPHPSFTAMEAAWDPVRREQTGPDCKANKHPACDGRALHEASDSIVACQCDCHQ